MSDTTATSHVGNQPRPYRRRVPILWWVRRRSYLLFVAREVSSVFVAWFVVFLLLLVRAVLAGEERNSRPQPDRHGLSRPVAGRPGSREVSSAAV